jgi:hypothetical protein
MPDLAFNYAFVRRADLRRLAPRFKPVWCETDENGVGQCLAERTGGCAPDPALTPILRMRRLGDGPVSDDP